MKPTNYSFNRIESVAEKTIDFTLSGGEYGQHAIRMSHTEALMMARLIMQEIAREQEFTDEWADLRLQMAAAQITPWQAMPAVVSMAHFALRRKDHGAATDFLRWLVVEVCGQEWIDQPTRPVRPAA